MNAKLDFKRWCAGTGTAMSTGAIFCVVIGRLEGRAVWGPALFGALYALAVLGLMRLLGARGWGLVFAGILCGPLPAALLAEAGAKAADRGPILIATAILGAFVGLLEWSRQAHDARGPQVR